VAVVAGVSPPARAADIGRVSLSWLKVPGAWLATRMGRRSNSTWATGVLSGPSSALLVDAWGHDVRRPAVAAPMLGTPLFLAPGWRGLPVAASTLPGPPSDYQKLQSVSACAWVVVRSWCFVGTYLQHRLCDHE